MEIQPVNLSSVESQAVESQERTDNESPATEKGLHFRFSGITKLVDTKPVKSGLIRSSSSLKCTSRTILKGVSGAAAPGEMLALMGPSGSGKTTLLNVLSGRSSYSQGTISINGEKMRTMKLLRSKIAYVKQFDYFLDHLTVRDQLTYTALLRLPGKTMTKEEKLKEVDRIISMLHLTWVADTQIFLLSGGERKRTNIGTELLTDPKVILCDEPCSGLDSTSAAALLRVLYSLAHEHGKTVVTSIHQPNSAMFRYSFDKLLMLCRGNVVYFGTPVDSIVYLKNHLFICPEGYNAADYWMDLLVWDGSIEEAKKGERNDDDVAAAKRPAKSYTQYLIEVWPADEIADQMDAEMCLHHGSMRSYYNAQTKPEKIFDLEKFNTTWTAQFLVLVHRCLKNSRSAIFTTLNMVKSAAIGLVVGCLWFQMEYTEKTVYDRSSFFFFTMAYWVFDSMFIALLTFPSERVVILKERASRSYHLSAYVAAKSASEAPARLTLPLFYMVIAYWMAGINPSFVVFLATTGITLLSVLAGESIGLLVGASIYDTDKAVTVVTVLALGLMLLGGFYVDNVPTFCQWVKYLSPFKYAYDAALQLIFDNPVACDGSSTLVVCAGLDSGVATTDEILYDTLNVQGSVGFNVGLLVLISCAARYGAYLALRATKPLDRS